MTYDKRFYFAYYFFLLILCFFISNGIKKRFAIQLAELGSVDSLQTVVCHLSTISAVVKPPTQPLVGLLIIK